MTSSWNNRAVHKICDSLEIQTAEAFIQLGIYTLLQLVGIAVFTISFVQFNNIFEFYIVACFALHLE